MQFIKTLEDMYEEQEGTFINLLITYNGSSSEEIIDKQILEQFRNHAAYIEKDRMRNQDLKDFGTLDQMNTVSLYWSKFSGFGKTYQIEKTCTENSIESIEIPLYGETTNQELL